MKKILLMAAIITLGIACGKKAGQIDERWFNNADFIKSVQLSDDEGVRGIISTTNIDLNARGEYGHNALLFAIEMSQNEKLIYEIAASGRIDLEAKDDQGRDALTLAAMNNPNEEVFLSLLLAGAQPKDLDALLDASYKNTNIHLPNMAGRLIIQIPWDKNTAFIEAIQMGNAPSLARELPFTDIHNSSLPQQTSPLYLALGGTSKDVVSLLIKYGANVNAYVIPEHKVTPLHYAASSRPPAFVDALIKAGADINARDINGFTPLMAAVRTHQDSAKVVALLIKNKADVNLADNIGDTALMIAARGNENADNILALLQAGAHINAQNKDGYTALILAAAYNKNAVIVETLIKEKADANIQNSAGFTALSAAAAQNENEQITDSLTYAEDIDLNHQTPQGFTPLMLAVAGNPNEKVAIALIEAGAEHGDLQLLAKYAALNKNPSLKDLVAQLNPAAQAGEKQANVKSKKAWYNNDKFAAAIEKGDVKALRAVISEGVNIHVLYHGARSITALMDAIAHTQSEEIISALIQEGADVNAANNNGDTALMVAALVTQNPKIIDTLVQAGANINAKDFGGVTALLSAAGNNQNEDIVRALLNAGADTTNIGALLEAATKNPNPKIREILQAAH